MMDGNKSSFIMDIENQIDDLNSVFIFDSFDNKKKVQICNWHNSEDTGIITSVSENNDYSFNSSIPTSSFQYGNRNRPCRILLISDNHINSKHLSYLLTSFFSECQLMCSFDICSEYDVFIRIMNYGSYDIFFLTKEIVLHPQFPAIFSNSMNSQTPIILYEKQKKRVKANSQHSSLSSDSSSISLNNLPTTPIYTLNNTAISGELYYPFTLIDLCTTILQYVFLPVYLQYNLDITVLQEKLQYIQHKLNQQINNDNSFTQDSFSSSIPIVALPSYDQSINDLSCPFVNLDLNSNQLNHTTFPSSSSFTETGVSSSLFETPSYDYSVPFFQSGDTFFSDFLLASSSPSINTSSATVSTETVYSDNHTGVPGIPTGMLGAPGISNTLKETNLLNEAMNSSTWSTAPEDLTLLSLSMNDCQQSRKRVIDDTVSISQRLEKRQRRISSLQEETVCLMKNGRILGEIKPDQSIESSWNEEEENGVLLFKGGQCEWKDLSGLIAVKHIHERSSSHPSHLPYSLKQEDLKRLCSRYCSIPSSSSSLQYLSTLSFPASSTIENDPVLKVTPQSIESESMTEEQVNRQAVIQSSLHTLLHSLFDDCEFYYPDVNNIPFLKYFASMYSSYS